MSLYRQLISSRCSNPCEVTCPQPYADAWNEPCVTSCGDSRAVVYPPPVVVTFPGPILSSCPQESYVGSSAPISIGSSFGYGSSFTYGGSLGYGGSCSPGSTYPCYSQRVNRYRYRSCGPCQTQKESTCTRNTQETKCKIQVQELADDCEKC